MVTIKEKPVVDTQNITIKELKHTSIQKSHRLQNKTSREEEARNKGSTKQKAVYKMAILSLYQ